MRNRGGGERDAGRVLLVGVPEVSAVSRPRLSGVPCPWEPGRPARSMHARPKAPSDWQGILAGRSRVGYHRHCRGAMTSPAPHSGFIRRAYSRWRSGLPAGGLASPRF
jgi:hypothetical protein